MTDGKRRHFQQLDWDDGDSDYYDGQSEDTPAEASSDRYPSRRSNRIMTYL